MDKNAIKKYAIWARRELIERVSQRAMMYGITARDAGDPNSESVNGHLLSQTEKRQRQALIRNIKTKGYEQVMEEVAYTWFNRFAALRFMEVNGYLPSHIRVFTNDAGEFKPQILAEAIHLELEGLDMNKVYELESANKSEELFKYLLIVQCNALNSILPGMFQRIEDYTELLLPDYLLREGSVIEQMVTIIPENDWTDQVEIIGWLYQYYNIESFDKIYDGDMSKGKVTKELLPAATQLFTPDWVVRYMVENTLGKIWIEGHPNDNLKNEWEFYLDEAEQEHEAGEKLQIIREEYATLKPEDIRAIDPCMGSGHILCVLFDVFMRIYEEYGYTVREAAVKIVENNIWGLDVDERATQLSYFAIMMKARQYDRRFFSRKVRPHVYAIRESNGIKAEYAHANRDFHISDDSKKTLDYLIEVFFDAKEYGSILQLEAHDYRALKEEWSKSGLITDEGNTLSLWSAYVSQAISDFIEQAIALSQQYHIVVTNPPYLGNDRFSDKLSGFIKSNYPDEKADLAVAMLKRINHGFLAKNGLASGISTVSWMFLQSFKAFRENFFHTRDLVSFVDYGTELFDGKVGHLHVAAWVCRNSRISQHFKAIRLVDFCYSRRDEKRPQFHNKSNLYIGNQHGFELIPGSPLAYYGTDAMLSVFENSRPLGEVANPKQGLITGNVRRFVRKWYEVDIDRVNFFGKKDDPNRIGKWFPYSNGGSFRKWYGNNEDLVDWENDGFAVINFKDDKGKQRSRPQNQQFYFCEGATWSAIAGGMFAVRYFPDGFLFSNAGMAIYSNHRQLLYLTGFLNTKLAKRYLGLFNEGLNCNQGDVARLPVVYETSRENEIIGLVEEAISISKHDWDSFESSWNFQGHPFVLIAQKMRMHGEALTIKRVYEEWERMTNIRFDRLKEIEEQLNEIFIDIYGLAEEMIPDMSEKDITIRRADLQREIRSLVSFAVGCMFGRYSLNFLGLASAGTGWDDEKYINYMPDKDGIIPVCDDEYFQDDIVGRFIAFVEAAFGKETLEDNLRLIADSLGEKGPTREALRNYFINDFYADHIKAYQKTPIYWLFDSGKKKGFKCLIYMHRYQPDTIARIRTDYVHEQQSRYRTAIADLEQRINGATTSERVKLSKHLTTLRAQAEEIRVYEEKIHHLADQMIKIDLDDGVKHNYEIFKDVLAKIK